MLIIIIFAILKFTPKMLCSALPAILDLFCDHSQPCQKGDSDTINMNSKNYDCLYYLEIRNKDIV